MLNWLPWKLVTKRLARSQGFIDPIGVYARLQNFSQPSEVAEPVELLRAGVIMHARGLINSRAIQHNLDWVWPYWVEKQFDPRDESFVPRAFSITHINLTHRNWSATGVPGLDDIPIVDPRGLVTPFWDGWSLDAWFVPKNGDVFLPSRADECVQRQHYNEDELLIHTAFTDHPVKMDLETSVKSDKGKFYLNLDVGVTSDTDGWLVIGLRPYNPEGVSFVDSIKTTKERDGWLVNKKEKVVFDRPYDRHHSSNYKDGDVFIHLRDREDDTGSDCNVGLVTAAAMFDTVAHQENRVSVRVPLKKGLSKTKTLAHAPDNAKQPAARSGLWSAALTEKADFQAPDAKMVELFEAAVRSLVLLSPEEIYAGPFTYKRFWYRDAVFIAHGLLSAGLVSRAGHIIEQLQKGQKRNGYFHSQEGEWDSNGQVLWLYKRYMETGDIKDEVFPWSVIENAAEWIINKRDQEKTPEWPGLMPAGFSAEHLGPNDFYLWDDYWSVAGLEAAAWVAGRLGRLSEQKRYKDEAKSMRSDIEESLKRTERLLKVDAIPAAPGRRMDAGAIGSVVASYPLRHYGSQNAKMLGTIDYLLKDCFVDNGFFQDMIHSGINAYLSLHVAQSLLRAGDSRYFQIVEAIAGLASPTGHWPEAVHPRTKGGCMGDGHHTWAAAEWAAMISSMFVREEDNQLIIGSGIPKHWVVTGEKCFFGPVPTAFGLVSVEVMEVEEFTPEKDPAVVTTATDSKPVKVTLTADWHSTPPEVLVALPGYSKHTISSSGESETVTLRQLGSGQEQMDEDLEPVY